MVTDGSADVLESSKRLSFENSDQKVWLIGVLHKNVNFDVTILECGRETISASGLRPVAGRRKRIPD